MIDLSKNFFYTEDKNGKIQKNDILFSFESEIDGNTYIVHTANEKDENGNVIVYASYVNEETHGNKLVNVEDDATFGIIEGMLVTLMGTVRGYTDESSFS